MTIDEWVSKGRDYNTGVEIFAQLSNNKSLITFFRQDPRFKERPAKLYNELMKLKPKEVVVPVSKQNLVNSNISEFPIVDSDNESPLKGAIGDVLVFKTGEVSILEIEKKDIEDPNVSTYPPVIQSAINMLSSFYKEKAKLWNERELLGYENTADIVAKRKKLSDAILDITNKMDPLYKIRNEYFASGIIPADVKPSEITTEGKSELPNNVEDLKAMKKGVQTNIGKDRNRLEYQNPNKQRVKTPMPAGPKRIVVEERIKERQELLIKIDEKLKSLNAT